MPRSWDSLSVIYWKLSLPTPGFWNALVVPRENLEEIRELLQEYPDRFLSPDPPVRDPIASLLPDGDLRFRETVLSCLRGISQSDLQAGTALLPDGRYRCGTIQGHSRPEGPAGFVGAAARPRQPGAAAARV